ncbi:MAG: glycoside hydrolase family 2 TIM barrel-domain containing protein [Bacteroidota bacterium]
MKKTISILAALIIAFSVNAQSKKQWSEQKANDWYKETGWLVGANFVPSTAQNPIEMWQASTFDPVTINRELGYAEKIGMNSMRVFLNFLVWQENPEAYISRIDHFLNIARTHHIKIMFIFFDDVWNPYSHLGDQGTPKPRTHNAGWVQCPGYEILTNEARHKELKPYVKSIMERFKDDERVIVWDLYNEPENNNGFCYNDDGKQPYSLKLLKSSFKWAREVNPSQPITSAAWCCDWNDSNTLSEFNKFMLENSDIITFHNYDAIEKFASKAEPLKKYNRPMMCTEYMGRTNKSIFETHLPYMKENNISAYNWGLVDGKSQTIFPWDSWSNEYPDEPKVWLHDVFRKDGTPYSTRETDLIMELTGKKAPAKEKKVDGVF